MQASSFLVCGKEGLCPEAVLHLEVTKDDQIMYLFHRAEKEINKVCISESELVTELFRGAKEPESHPQNKILNNKYPENDVLFSK